MAEIKLSVSKVKSFKGCKKHYEFSYIKKLPSLEFPHHTFGKLAHKALEDFHNHYINNTNSSEFHNKVMTESFKSACNEYKDKMTKDMQIECKEILTKYLNILANDKLNSAAYNVLKCEDPFELIIENENTAVKMNGFIDRIQLDPDGIIHVADYKTVKNEKYLKDDFFQLLTYAYIILHKNPDIDKVRASYIMLRHNFKYITKDFHKEEILEIKDKYLSYAEDILAETTFKANPTALCNYCSYLNLCEEGQKKANPIKVFGEINW